MADVKQFVDSAGNVYDISVPAGKIGASELAPNAVTTEKIANNAVTRDKIAPAALTHKMSLPGDNSYGNSGQYPRSTGNGIEWVDYGSPTQEQTDAAVAAWLEDHPEATTTVEDRAVTNQKLHDGAVSFEKLDDDLAETIDNKADYDGYYSTLTAGAAENLVGRGSVNAEFTRRTSGGSADIGTGSALIKKLKGKTMVWNQLCNNGDFSNGTTNWTITRCTGSVSDKVITLTATQAIANNYIIYQRMSDYLSKFIVGHKYIFFAEVNSDVSGANLSAGNQQYLSQKQYAAGSGWKRISTYFNVTQSEGLFFCIYAHSLNIGETLSARNLCVFDVTKMFGAGNEPSTVDEFDALFNHPYYEYNTGKLLSFAATGIKTDGFNQWDEQWERGNIASSTGANASSTTLIRSKNFIRVFEGMTYYIKGGSGSSFTNIYIRHYDINKNYIPFSDTIVDINRANTIYTIPQGCAYIRIVGAGTQYGNDVSINLSWSGYRNGEYEPYRKQIKSLPVKSLFTPATYSASSTYAVGDLCIYNGAMYQCKTAIVSGEAWNASHWNLIRAAGVGEMLSAGSAYDEITEDGMVIRVGCVDMGELNWSAIGASYPNQYYAYMDLRAVGAYLGGVCAKYSKGAGSGFSSLADKAYQYGSSDTRIFLMDTAYSTAASLKTSLSGVMLYFELATPIVIKFGSSLPMSYWADDFGTEMRMEAEEYDETSTYALNAYCTKDAETYKCISAIATPEEWNSAHWQLVRTPLSAPISMDVTYPMNAVDVLRNLGKNYISKESLDSLCTTLLSAYGITLIPTYNAAENKYTFAMSGGWQPVPSAPASPTAAGAKGYYFLDSTNGYLYVCVAANTWRRVALTTW